MAKKKELQNSIQIIDPKIIAMEVEKTMPEWVAKMHDKEDMANSILASSQEMWLAIIDTLIRYHNWEEFEIKQFNQEIKDVLTGLKEFEDSGLSMLSPHSVGIVGEKISEIGIGNLLVEIAQIRNKKEKLGRIGMEVPVMPEAKTFLKKLKEKNK